VLLTTVSSVVEKDRWHVKGELKKKKPGHTDQWQGNLFERIPKVIERKFQN